MNLSYDYYRVFYYVARFGNITQAANALFCNQPNVTRTIKLLEQGLGCTLLVRSNRGVTLTPEGELLLSHVAPAMEHLESAERELCAQGELRQGLVSLGASEVALRCLLLPVLKAFRAAHPGVRVRVTNSTTPQALSALQDGLVDLAVVTTPLLLPKGLDRRVLKQVREVPVCADAYRAALSGPLGLEDLARYPLVSLGSGSATYQFYAEWFAQNGLSFRPEVEAATADQILPLVRSCLGLGFVPEDFLRDDAESAGISRLTLCQPVPPRSICLVTRTGQPLRAAAKKLEALLLAAD